MTDLILLVADKNAQFALKGALNRPKALGIRPISFEIFVHSGRDGGARRTGPEMLASQRRRFGHALLVLDFEGSGTKSSDAIALEGELDRLLAEAWEKQAKSIVIEPELDVWIWGSDNPVATVIEWPPGVGMRDWLRHKGHAFAAHEKPNRPKEAMEAILREVGIPRSSALYQRIAEKISLGRCLDAAFVRFRQRLQDWFPER